MWENYVKPILKTNLYAIGWYFLLYLPVGLLSGLFIKFYLQIDLASADDVYLSLPNRIYETLTYILIIIVVNYKSAVFLYHQHTISKIRLLNVYILTGVFTTILFTFASSFYFPFMEEVVFNGLFFIIDILLFVLITKYVFQKNGKVDLKKLLRI